MVEFMPPQWLPIYHNAAYLFLAGGTDDEQFVWRCRAPLRVTNGLCRLPYCGMDTMPCLVSRVAEHSSPARKKSCVQRSEATDPSSLRTVPSAFGRLRFEETILAESSCSY